MRAIDADRLLEEHRMHTYYHLPNGDTAVPIVDIQHAPTVEPKPHWIPCSERLPEDDVYVLISKRPNLLSGKKWCVTIAGRFKGARNNLVEWKDIGFGKLQDDEILAWMPLPESYSGE